MAAKTPPLKRIVSSLLSTALACSTTSVVAQTPLKHDEEWGCRADQQGQWLCQPQPRSGNSYRPNTVTAAQNNSNTIKKSTDTTATKTATKTTAASAYNQWDWVPKQQLDDSSSCPTGCEGYYQAPASDWEDSDKDPEFAPLRADADSSNYDGGVIVLSNDVHLTQGNRRFKADKATLNRTNNELTIEGNVELREPNLLVRADSAHFNTDSNTGYFQNALFLNHDSGTRGQAQRIQRSNTNTIDMQQGSITQCTPDDELWLIKASSLHLDQAEGWGSAKHARLNIKDVPVLYIPYMTFPIDERRKSGFLMPTLATSNTNGFEFSAPYYLNLAPNYDATIAPRYIEKRGVMTELELRQMGPYGHWAASGAYLEDDQYTDAPPTPNNDNPPQEQRWIGAINHTGSVLGLRTTIDYSKVSDSEYFDDLSTDSLDIKRTTHLSQHAALGFRSEAWLANLKVQNYQTVDPLLDDQYQMMPQLNVMRNASGANFRPEWLVNVQLTDFQHRQSFDEGGNFVTGQRAFAEAGASYPMRWAAGFIIPSVKVRNVNYDLDATAPGADTNPSATTPLTTLDMGLIFDRNIKVGNSHFIQTLEPRAYYFYSEYQQQNAHPLFDTQELNFSYSQLFRDTRFTGHDRLDDANQTSFGLTSRFISQHDGHEILSLSLGQTFYFADRKVGLNPGDADNRLSSSLVASEIRYQTRHNLWISNTLLWDSRAEKMQEGGISFQYQTDNASLFNLSYRYNRNGAANLGSGLRNLSQVDGSLVYPINDRWRLFSRLRYDTEENISLDELVGLEYEDCCWSVSVLYQQGVKNQTLDPLSNQIVTARDYAFILEFQLKGLGSLGNKAASLLNENILGYENLEN